LAMAADLGTSAALADGALASDVPASASPARNAPAAARGFLFLMVPSCWHGFMISLSLF
jgi:hypothetical protein